jgi:Holliday junction resolvase-like predicted endonuclease
MRGLGIGGLVLIFFIVFLMKIVETLVLKKERTIKRTVRRAERGAVAEEEVGEVLGRLPEGWEVFHDVRSPYGNIDHVLVGDDGIFVIETKSHRGRVSAQGSTLLIDEKPTEKDFIGQTLGNALWLRDMLKEKTGNDYFVHALLVFTRAFVPRLGPIKGVHVMNVKFLPERIERLKRRGQSTAHAVEVVKSLQD